jgi:hypothetical protein
VRDSSTWVCQLTIRLHPLLPTDIASQIQNFKRDPITRKQFTVKRAGITRQPVPLERILSWQEKPITSPILVMPKDLSKEALLMFKVIQHTMGQREGLKPVNGIPLSQLCDTGTSIIHQEIRWLLEIAMERRKLRDEVYCQLIKQLTKNPSR